jgi:hypothetical protein
MFGLARTQFNAQKFDLAIASYQKVMELAPTWRESLDDDL